MEPYAFSGKAYGSAPCPVIHVSPNGTPNVTPHSLGRARKRAVSDGGLLAVVGLVFIYFFFLNNTIYNAAVLHARNNTHIALWPIP